MWKFWKQVAALEEIGVFGDYAEAIVCRPEIYESLDEYSREDLKELVELDPGMKNFFAEIKENYAEHFDDFVSFFNTEEKIKLYLILKNKENRMQYVEHFSKHFLQSISFKIASRMNTLDFSNFINHGLFINTAGDVMVSFIDDMFNGRLDADRFRLPDWNTTSLTTEYQNYDYWLERTYENPEKNLCDGRVLKRKKK